MKQRFLFSSLLALAALALGACGSATEVIGKSVDESRVVESHETPATDEVLFWLSNQSGDDTSAQLSMEVDGVLVIDRVFETGDAHNFHPFNVNALPPGEHTVVARSDSGFEITETFEKTDAPLWIVIHYWGRDLSGGFSFELSNEPVEFA